ncbi:MAG TPA: hypothetical protein VFW87_00165, partial [Pirellulales bacterium]|nr:hypothetical protein [Pirellulales bacterium]
HAEFADAVTLMRASCRVIELAAPADAVDWCATAETPPALVVLAVARPGRFREESVERLRQRLPLAPCVALLGAWCEGEMRSGAPWSGMARVYWHQWPQRFAQELHRLAAGQCGGWTLPVTASPEEHLLWHGSTAVAPRHGVAAIVADRGEAAEWLMHACGWLGWAAIWSLGWRGTKMQGVDVVLWDAGLIAPEAFARLPEIGKQFGGAPVVALADFPRFEHQRLFDASGAAAILAKPFLLCDLAGQLARWAGRRPPACR